jgi:RNA polymerase sigma factor (sigma-70 family)
MSRDETIELQSLIDRMLRGDDAARTELIGRSYERLRRLASKILHADFARLENTHETGTVLHEAVLRLLQALRTVETPTVRDFFRFSATQIRRVLLDLTRRQALRGSAAGSDHPGDSSSSPPTYDRPDSTNDPAKLALWTEFHQKVEDLPPEEREVVDLHWYQGLSQAEAARILGLHPREVSRRWVRAIRQLPEWVP